MAIPLPVLDVLDAITIPTPCTVPWDAMQGDDRTRFCGKCKQNVHDVSELTAAEAVRLLGASAVGADKLPCLRIRRRPDGRVLTADCPRTRRERVWSWLRRRSTWAASLFAVLFLGGCRDPREPAIAGGICLVSNPQTEVNEQDNKLHDAEHLARSK